jgi:hypothetical protein
MQEIELTPTRKDALEFADYLANHPQPEPIPLAALFELAERAQIRAEVVKIVAETTQIADERIDWQAICEQHDPQLDGLRLDIDAERKRQNAPMPDPQFFRGAINGLLLEIIIAAFVFLMIYGHRLALWIDSWRLSW